MGKGTVIVYGGGDGDRKKLKPLCGKLDLRLRWVLPEEMHQPVGAFAGAEKFRETTEPGELPGMMLVFANVTDRQLESFLSGMKTARVGGGSLKAVLTETNSRWTGPELYRELSRERAELEPEVCPPGKTDSDA